MRDPYLRFYFRFVSPNERALELELMDAVWDDVRAQLRAFIGMTTFEELCREWVLIQARSRRLPFASPQGNPFVPEDVGSHWGPDVQVDVVAPSWREKAILLGECKWGTNRVGRAWIRELIEEKRPKVLAALPEKGEGWTVFYAFFARAGFTEAAQVMAEAHDIQLVELEQLDRVLRTA